MAPRTTSATGDPRGFTLLEVLLALALIALLATVFIAGSSALLAAKPLSPDDQFWKMCADARKAALEKQRDVSLSYDTRSASYLIDDGGGPKSIGGTGGPDMVVDFLPGQPDATSGGTLVGGTLVETGSLHAVLFYSDGTCTPFRAQIRLNGGAHILAVDPWTCAPVLPAADVTP